VYILQNLWHPIHAWYIFYFDPFSFNVILSHEKSKSIDFHLKINKQKKFENHIKKKKKNSCTAYKHEEGSFAELKTCVLELYLMVMVSMIGFSTIYG